MQAVLAQLQDAGQVLPGPGDGLVLEVVAKAEVPQHLEKSVMAIGAAHIVDVIGADAFLATGGARVIQLHRAQKLGLERHHARDGEQKAGIVRDQGRRGLDGVALALEKVEIGLA